MTARRAQTHRYHQPARLRARPGRRRSLTSGASWPLGQREMGLPGDSFTAAPKRACCQPAPTCDGSTRAPRLVRDRPSRMEQLAEQAFLVHDPAVRVEVGLQPWVPWGRRRAVRVGWQPRPIDVGDRDADRPPPGPSELGGLGAPAPQNRPAPPPTTPPPSRAEPPDPDNDVGGVGPTRHYHHRWNGRTRWRRSKGLSRSTESPHLAHEFRIWISPTVIGRVTLRSTGGRAPPPGAPTTVQDAT
jgi:hypothetical protein